MPEYPGEVDTERHQELRAGVERLSAGGRKFFLVTIRGKQVKGPEVRRTGIKP
jgi:hypothetical protein